VVITLYGPAQAPYTEKVRRALIYKGLAFELRQPESPEDYKRWSPKTGMLPVLDLDGEHVPDSTQIMLRLDEVYPQPPLLSTDPKVAQQQRQLEDWADHSFSWHYMRYLHMVGDGFVLPVASRDTLPGEGREPGPSRSPIGRRFIAWIRAGGTWERPITGLQRQLGARLDDLVNFLGSRPFFYADRLSMADLAVYGMLWTMRYDAIPGSSRLLAERPSLIAFMTRVESQTGG
jgi:glutathione S-transferase